MKKNTLVLIPLLLATSCSAFLTGTRSEEGIEEDVTQRSIGAWITDEEIEDHIRINLAAQDETLEEANIAVTAHKGVVLLVGQVPSPELKQRAVRIAGEASSEIRRIHDELEVSANISFLTRRSDDLTSTRVRFRLWGSDSEVDSDIRVVTENGTVYLMGVLRREEGDELAALVSDVPGVTRVVKIFEYVD